MNRHPSLRYLARVFVRAWTVTDEKREHIAASPWAWDSVLLSRYLMEAH